MSYEITREKILTNSVSVWPKNSVPYSMASLFRGCRQDCSGYVFGACWGILAGYWGGPSTVSAVSDGHVSEIRPDQLQPGDCIGKLGPGTGGAAGHVMLWVGRAGNEHRIREQRGGTRGWTERVISWPAGYRAYRNTHLIAGPIPFVPNGSRTLRLASPMMVGTDVRYVQAFIGAMHAGAPDGWYGPQTVSGVRWYQTMRGIAADGIVGPVTWAHLLGRVS